MEMEFATQLAATAERLAAATSLLEQTLDGFASRLAASHTELAASAETRPAENLPSSLDRIDRIVATVDSSRDSELVAKLAAAEQRIAELEARAAAPEASTGRKTVPASSATLFGKHGMTADSIQAGALDAALVHLSLEQRIAVKSELLRAGMIG